MLLLRNVKFVNCYMGIEIVTFVVQSWPSLPVDRSKSKQVWIRSVALRRVFDRSVGSVHSFIRIGSSLKFCTENMMCHIHNFTQMDDMPRLFSGNKFLNTTLYFILYLQYPVLTSPASLHNNQKKNVCFTAIFGRKIRIFSWFKYKVLKTSQILFLKQCKNLLFSFSHGLDNCFGDLTPWNWILWGKNLKLLQNL